MTHMSDARPDPAELLARAAREDAARGRGHLKIFFGMAPGVGKTFAMLAAAQRMARDGVDVVVGIVETHGRTETEQMLLGLDILARKQIEYRGAATESTAPVTLQEFDLDAALARHPDILLVDELAHTNAPGSHLRFEKRWQDVHECLKAGINVYTTLNVQHIESLNDVIAQITGVAVKETVPDWVIDEADEIELIDLPPDALLERLKAGKVYLAENAARAVDATDGFFRKGNLTALRELALRRTAAWVDSEMREYKADRGIRAVWPAGERILVAVSPSPMSATLVRAAKRMAAGLHADLLAVYVEQQRATELSAADRERVTQTLRLAESLGATTTTLSATNAAAELIAFARARNVSKIVVGKTGQSRFREALSLLAGGGSFVANLIRQSGDIDIYVIRGDADNTSSFRGSELAAGTATGTAPGARHSPAWMYAAVLLLVGTITLVGHTVFGALDISNVAMIYLGAVVIAAVWLGRGPAVLAAIAGVAAFDFFFVPPRLTLAVSDVQYLLTFVVMLAVGLLIAGLTTRLREFASASREREARTATLYAMSRELAAAQNATQVATIGTRHVHDALACDAVVSHANQSTHGSHRADTLSSLDPLAFSGSPDWFDDRERSVAQLAIDHNTSAGRGTQRLPSASGRHIPLTGSAGKLGVLSLRPRDNDHLLATANALLLENLANQIATALERVSLIETQQAARLEAERERLRSALLSSVSHDLRTPLASITGAASVLEQSGDALDEPARASLLATIVSESTRLNDLIANLVFATRLEAGGITLTRQWTTVEEVVGVGLTRHREQLMTRPFRTTIPTDLPLLYVDNAMLPQVIHNLVENALRYTPAITPLGISAWSNDTSIVIKVADEGPGLDEGESSRIFQRFYRGRAAKSGESPAPHARAGMGLGLTICEGIVNAHGGRIWAEPNTPRGVAFQFSIPITRPQPMMPK